MKIMFIIRHCLVIISNTNIPTLQSVTVTRFHYTNTWMWR